MLMKHKATERKWKKMLKQTIKRLVVTGAAVMVMMSFAAPAMAYPMAYPSNPVFTYPSGGDIVIGDINSGGNTGNTTGYTIYL